MMIKKISILMLLLSTFAISAMKQQSNQAEEKKSRKEMIAEAKETIELSKQIYQAKGLLSHQFEGGSEISEILITEMLEGTIELLEENNCTDCNEYFHIQYLLGKYQTSGEKAVRVLRKLADQNDNIKYKAKAFLLLGIRFKEFVTQKEEIEQKNLFTQQSLIYLEEAEAIAMQNKRYKTAAFAKSDIISYLLNNTPLDKIKEEDIQYIKETVDLMKKVKSKKYANKFKAFETCYHFLASILCGKNNTGQVKEYLEQVLSQKENLGSENKLIHILQQLTSLLMASNKKLGGNKEKRFEHYKNVGSIEEMRKSLIKLAKSRGKNLSNVTGGGLSFNQSLALNKKRVKKTEKKFTCQTCKKEAPCKVCSRCKKAYYCSPECQKKDWSEHKKHCIPKKEKKKKN